MGHSPPGRAVTEAEGEALVDEPHCEECSTLSSRATTGWRTVLAGDGAPIHYCPSCWAREFGEDVPPGEPRP